MGLFSKIKEATSLVTGNDNIELLMASLSSTNLPAMQYGMGERM